MSSAAMQESNTPNLEAIMHVPIEVSVELARIKLPLHVVARLARGAVVELNRDATSDVEILANGSIFARGEVVATNGKLAVRIVEVVSAAERLRALS